MTPDITNPENTPPSLPASQPVLGYCRGCGTPLTAETARYAMGTMYCAQHVPAAASAGASATADNPYASTPPPPPPASDVSPGLAFFLGLIPGVGAIYNGQYAKGLLHVVVFGFLIAIQDHDSPLPALVGLLIPTFIFYMAFEAMHTAKSRMLGLPVDEFSSIAPLGDRAGGFPVGPVILMAVGVFFLLANLDLISVRAILRWWPVGLIALGAYMLYVRTLGGGESSEPR